ncbi:MAG: hypothetical protein LBQ59_03795 [Candidatus Peribacteria bacterium]|nr:hypothetical protein [Candidatus Peribacteria bacterium]
MLFGKAVAKFQELETASISANTKSQLQVQLSTSIINQPEPSITKLLEPDISFTIIPQLLVSSKTTQVFVETPSNIKLQVASIFSSGIISQVSPSSNSSVVEIIKSFGMFNL